MPTLTVGLPVHNGMPYLPETVESLLAQTWRDFELLVIDDGSTDGTADYLATLSDSRVRVVHQDNRGLQRTLNRLLDECATDWLVRQDADDIALPERLAVIAEHAARYPDTGVFYSMAEYHDMGPRRVSFRQTVGSPAVLRNLTRAGYLLAICHPTAVLHVGRTRAVGGYRPQFTAAEDSDLWWRMSLAHDIRMIPQTLLAYRLVPGSISSTHLLRQARQQVYIQYLLLSHLWGLEPQPPAAVRDTLDGLLDLELLRYREHVRRAGMAYGRRRYARSAVSAARAVLASPRSLARRLRYEARPASAPAVAGVEPILFATHSDALWPGQLAPAGTPDA